MPSQSQDHVPPIILDPPPPGSAVTNTVIVLVKAGQAGFGPEARALDAQAGGAVSRAVRAPRCKGKAGECIDLLAPPA